MFRGTFVKWGWGLKACSGLLQGGNLLGCLWPLSWKHFAESNIPKQGFTTVFLTLGTSPIVRLRNQGHEKIPFPIILVSQTSPPFQLLLHKLSPPRDRGQILGYSLCPRASHCWASAWSRLSRADSDRARSRRLINYIITHETCRHRSLQPGGTRSTQALAGGDSLFSPEPLPAHPHSHLIWAAGQEEGPPPASAPFPPLPAVETKAGSPRLAEGFGGGTCPTSVPLQPPGGTSHRRLHVTQEETEA